MDDKGKSFWEKVNFYPRDKQDYYKVGIWLVSKRLAFFIVLFIFIISLIYLIWSFPVGIPGGNKGIPAFSYKSLPLKFYQGKAEIIGAAGKTVYVGQVSRGTVQGKGTLYGESGTPRYMGEFQDGEFSGKGKLLRDDGTKEYEGQFKEGKKAGQGTLYNQNEQPVFTGDFSWDGLIYEDFLGVTTAEIADKYKGEQVLYTFDGDMCGLMQEIDVLYCAGDGKDRLDGQWRSDAVYVLKDTFSSGPQIFTNPKELETYFGPPDYEGTTILTVWDVAAMNALTGVMKDKYERAAALTLQEEFDDAKTITDYTRTVECYIYTYKGKSINYTFFTYGKNKGFAFYLMEKEL